MITKIFTLDTSAVADRTHANDMAIQSTNCFHDFSDGAAGGKYVFNDVHILPGDQFFVSALDYKSVAVFFCIDGEDPRRSTPLKVIRGPLRKDDASFFRPHDNINIAEPEKVGHGRT